MGHGRPEQFHRIISPGWYHHHDARNFTECGDAIVVVKVPADPFLVSERRHTDHHAVGQLTVGKE